MTDSVRASLEARFLVCSHTLKDLLAEIKKIEDDTQASVNEKILKIKMIRGKITEVGMEIDKLKKEIKLMSAYSIN